MKRMCALLLACLPPLVSIGCAPAAGGKGAAVPADHRRAVGETGATPAAPEFAGHRHSNLVDFATDADAVFVTATPAPAAIDPAVGRGARGSGLRLPPGTTSAVVKLPSLLSGRAFPGEWTLVGGYLFPERPTRLTLAYELAGRALLRRELSLQPGQWNAAMLDLAQLPAQPATRAAATAGDGDVGVLTMRFDDGSAPGAVWLDDLVLIDNAQTLVDATAQGGWIVRRRGLRFELLRPGGFTLALDTTEASPAGWQVVEANELRARFRAPAGPARSLTAYRDGRAFADGAFKALAPAVRDDRAYAAAHASPADVSVPEGLGRVSRNTPGDANNDGYNEALGAYQVVAQQPRLEVTLVPRDAPQPRPILQIANFPAGKVLVTTEGKLVERSVRLQDGQLLVELPARVERRTTVNLRLQ